MLLCVEPGEYLFDLGMSPATLVNSAFYPQWDQNMYQPLGNGGALQY